MKIFDTCQSMVSSTLHQTLVQWVGDEIETIHADSSTCVAMVDVPIFWTYDTTKCLIRVDFLDYKFINVCREGFTS
jgi:hypothetical protein